MSFLFLCHLCIPWGTSVSRRATLVYLIETFHFIKCLLSGQGKGIQYFHFYSFLWLIIINILKVSSKISNINQSAIAVYVSLNWHWVLMHPELTNIRDYFINTLAVHMISIIFVCCRERSRWSTKLSRLCHWSSYTSYKLFNVLLGWRNHTDTSIFICLLSRHIPSLRRHNILTSVS